jgi:hypothetical protein
LDIALINLLFLASCLSFTGSLAHPWAVLFRLMQQMKCQGRGWTIRIVWARITAMILWRRAIGINHPQKKQKSFLHVPNNGDYDIRCLGIVVHRRDENQSINQFTAISL